MTQASKLDPSARRNADVDPHARTGRFRAYAAPLTGALAASLFAVLLPGCGNLIETASCKESCDDAERQCLLYGALANQTPSNDPAPGSVLFLNCRSALYVCRASCDEEATRL